MSFGFNQIKWDTTKKIASKEVVVKTSVSEMESGGATKIFDVIADGKLMSLDAAGEIARVFGRVNFKLLYADKEGEIRGLDYFADFNESLQIENLSGKIFGKINVIDVDTSISGGIKLSAIVEITVFSITEREVKCLMEADDNLYVEKNPVKFQKFITSFNTSFSVSDDFDTKTDVMKIVLSDADAYVDSVNAGVGNVLITGGVKAIVTYLADDTVKIADFSIPFSEEFDCPEIAIGQALMADIDVKNLRIVLTGIEGSNIIRSEIELEVTVKAFDNMEDNIVTDIFSVEKELNEKRENIVAGSYCGYKYFNDNLTGEATLSADILPALEVLGVISSRNSVAQTMADDGIIVVEGVFSAVVLYRNEEGVASAETELPYSLSFMYEGLNKNDIVTGEGAVVKVSAKLKRDREIEVNAVLGIMTGRIAENEYDYITEISEGEDKDVNKSAVSVFIADDGDSIWDAAKALSARPDDIRAQNPDLDEPMKEGDKVFYYRHINFEF